MDAITQAFSSLNSTDLKDATEVAGLGSTAYSMYNQYQNQQYQNLLRSYAQDPAKMNAYAAQFTQPLTAGLQTGVANAAQADIANRGLSDSPQIAQQVYAQAIAPYIQQQQNQGYQNALQALQVGGGAVNPNNNSPQAIAALAKMFASGPGANQMNRGAFNELMQAGTVQPVQEDTWPAYTPDFSSQIAPPTTPDVGSNDISDWYGSAG